MIKKIRSYLLEDEDNKSSIGIYVSILLLAPLFAIFWEYKRKQSPVVLTVDNKALEKSIFGIKLYEQKLFLDKISSLFGEESGRDFYFKTTGGLSTEQFVLQSEVKRLFLSSRFDSFFYTSSIVKDVLRKLLFEKNNGLYSILGPLVFIAITSPKQAKESNIFTHIDMAVVDRYAMDSFGSSIMSDIFSCPLKSLERLTFRNKNTFPVGILSIIFKKVSFSKSNDLRLYRDMIEKNLVLSEEDLMGRYNSLLTSDRFRKDREGSAIVFSYKAHAGEEKELSSFYESAISSFQGEESLLKSHFDRGLREISQVPVSFVLRDNGVFINSDTNLVNNFSSSVSQERLFKVFEEAANTNASFVSFFEDGVIYFFSSLVFASSEQKSFDEARLEIIKDITDERVSEAIERDITKIRYDLESGVFVRDNYQGWHVAELLYSKEEDDKKDNENKRFIDLVNKKIVSGGMRKGASFVDHQVDSCVIYFCQDIVVDNQSQLSLQRQDSFLEGETFALFLSKKAKVDIISPDEPISF
jgi:hypothetical protein